MLTAFVDMPLMCSDYRRKPMLYLLTNAAAYLQHERLK